MSLDNFLALVNKLKSTKRTGWVERGINNSESVADHSWMMALMCMALPEKGVDKDKVIRMTLVHDIAESVVGDIISKDSWEQGGTMHREEKVELERSALSKILKGLDKSLADEIRRLWEEFEEGKTKEALFVRDMDTAEMVIQAKIYHNSGNFRKPLEPFWDSKNMGKIRNERIKTLVRMIIGK